MSVCACMTWGAYAWVCGSQGPTSDIFLSVAANRVCACASLSVCVREPEGSCLLLLEPQHLGVQATMPHDSGFQGLNPSP